ncbi:hypothetical protein F4780DRAFT_338805 [Xylariomycetidae sp. FL0641]|nr:hypothetical protein F4780DRAFT_338805 [Xylariomycetidae sp. FL0641]
METAVMGRASGIHHLVRQAKGLGDRATRALAESPPHQILVGKTNGRWVPPHRGPGHRKTGAVRHLWECVCSIQRRYQKIIGRFFFLGSELALQVEHTRLRVWAVRRLVAREKHGLPACGWFGHTSSKEIDYRRNLVFPPGLGDWEGDVIEPGRELCAAQQTKMEVTVRADKGGIVKRITEAHLSWDSRKPRKRGAALRLLTGLIQVGDELLFGKQLDSGLLFSRHEDDQMLDRNSTCPDNI